MALRLSNSNSENSSAPSRGKKTIEQTYTKLSQLEHVLVRPDTYVGSIERMPQSTWVWDNSTGKMVYKEISYPPGLYKIFDEILVNAADHAQRDKSMDCIKVDVDTENQFIAVWNNGSGIPVEMHQKEKVYVPELIFGHLLTSSNYDDNEKKVVGGRNGFGAKLANIFSTEFIIETADANNGKKFKQVFRKNMTIKEAPIIRANPKKEAYTKITFFPELSRFGLTYLDEDIVSLMEKRVHDIAGVNSSVKVYLNGSRINVKTFKDYVALYPSETDGPIAHERLDDRWEVAIAASDGQLNQVSFVNSIWTIKGGNHVNHVADGIAAKLAEHIQKKNKGVTVKPFQIKSHLSLFINCLIENPSFDSQTKETLLTKPSKFGSKWTFSDDLAKKVVSKTSIVENILEFARFKQNKELAKTDGGKKSRLIGIGKLDDANKAGGREASKCTLILTEGDSAKALAISGLSVVGRDYYGVFPLRGKLLNVREAKHKQIMDNSEINNLKKILGLQHGKVYDAESVKSLRYGHVLIMTDQDHDGSHIKGLVINFFDHFWPSLLSVKGFVQEFITPIVKCVKGREDRVFFTIPQYKNWVTSLEGTQRGWVAKYYKGLGTSTPAEAKGYFSNLPRHLHMFKHCGPEDSDMIELAFSKQRVNDRKTWLSGFTPGTYFDHEEDELNYSNFVNKELILFSVADNSRSIPSVIDGFKPSQRKVLYACFKRKLTKNEIKVAQLAGYVSEHAAYHHGEMSLQATIVGLAQNFVGSNNLNLLVPSGQFGTRLQGGKDAASSRYIFTKLSPLARALFPEVDDPLLTYLEEEGTRIEPTWYCPIIPLVLVNGSDGIGTGWSSFIPCYNPRDLIRNVRHLLDGEPMEHMDPWYRGFNGTIIPVENANAYDVYGTLRRCQDEHTFKIDELPVRTWTTPYKEYLESNMVGNSDAKTPFVKDYQDNGTENKVNFTFTTTAEFSSILSTSEAYRRLKLTTTLSTNNMVLFDVDGRIRRYNSPEEILEDFFRTRLALYDQRRVYLLHELEQELLCLDNKQRFILMVIDGKLKVAKRKKIELIRDLKRLEFDQIFKQSTTKVINAADQDANKSDDEESAETGEVSEKDSGYDYLLSMPLWSLTAERVQQLRNQRDKKDEEKKAMEVTTGKALWESDLQNLESVIEKDEKEAKSLAADLERVAREARAKQRRGGNKRKGAKSVIYDEKSDEEDLEVIELPSVRTVVAKVPRARKPVTAAKSVKPRKNMSKNGKQQLGQERLHLDDDLDESSDEHYSEHSELEDDTVDDLDNNFGDISNGIAGMSLSKTGKASKAQRKVTRTRRGANRSEKEENHDEASEVLDLTEENESTTNTHISHDRRTSGSHDGSVTLGKNEEDVFEIDDEIEVSTFAEGKSKTVSSKKTSILTESNVKNSSDSELEMSLSERIAKKLNVSRRGSDSSSSAKGSTAVQKKTKTTVKKKNNAAVKRGAVAKAKVSIESVEIELSPGKSPKPKKSRVKSPKGNKKKVMTKNVESVDDQEEEKVKETVPPSVRGRPKRAATRKVLIESDSADDFDEEAEIVDVDDSDSDFE